MTELIGRSGMTGRQAEVSAREGKTGPAEKNLAFFSQPLYNEIIQKQSASTEFQAAKTGV